MSADVQKQKVSIDASVTVTMSELSDWRPDRIAALFAGIAQVLSVKAKAASDVPHEPNPTSSPEGE